MRTGSDAGYENEREHESDEEGEKGGWLKGRRYGPFAVEAFIAALRRTDKKLAGVDRTKEPEAAGEPLYKDVLSAIAENLTQAQLRELMLALSWQLALADGRVDDQERGAYESLAGALEIDAERASAIRERAGLPEA